MVLDTDVTSKAQYVCITTFQTILWPSPWPQGQFFQTLFFATINFYISVDLQVSLTQLLLDGIILIVHFHVTYPSSGTKLMAFPITYQCHITLMTHLFSLLFNVILHATILPYFIRTSSKLGSLILILENTLSACCCLTVFGFNSEIY